MKALLKKLLAHFNYPSTWKGLITVLATVGVSVAPELAEHIATVGVATVGLIAFFFSDADVKSKK